MKFHWTKWAMLLFAVSLALFFGCSEEEDPGILEPDPADNDSLANVRVDQANQMLEALLFTQINNPPEQVDDVDMSAAYDLYMEACDLDTDNPGGNFGAGVLEIFMLAQDPVVQQFFEDVENYFEQEIYFIEEGGVNPFAGMLGERGVKLPLAAPGMLDGYSRSVMDYGYNTGDMQAFLVEMLVPKINEALSHLELVTLTPDFEFDVTPTMQGDPDEDPVELDMTEVYAMMMALHGMNAIIQQLCAYDFDLGEYTGDDLLNAVRQNSSFATLKPNGAGRMSAALVAWQNSIAQLEAGLAFLDEETDYQGDDLIRYDPYDGLTDEVMDSIHYYLPKVKAALNSSANFTFEVNGQPEVITISMNSYFSDPVQNPKSLLPPYTVELTLSPDGHPDWNSLTHDEYNEMISITAASNEYYFWYKSGDYFRGELSHMYHDRNFDSIELEGLFNEMVGQHSADDYCNVYVYYSGYVEEGTHQYYAYVAASYGEVPYRYSPVIIWNANSGADWIFPDPTMGGLLPGMTDARFKYLIEWSEDDFQKVEEWDLWHGDW